jgi:hypothetical protein
VADRVTEVNTCLPEVSPCKRFNLVPERLTSWEAGLF